MPTTMCPLCFRQIATDGEGRLKYHTHTPMLAERCEGSGLTPEAAKRETQLALATWHAAQKSKPTTEKE